MSQKILRPSWVIDQSLNTQFFKCCGDEDLFPFKCHACGRPFVLCYECDTLYTDLHDLSSQRFLTGDNSSCPRCGAKFDDDSMRSPHDRITFDEWHAAGLDNLLVHRPVSELFEMMIASAEQIAGFLRRGMRSTARMEISELINLAESIAVHHPEAAAFREQGFQVAQSQTLAAAMEWHSRIPNVYDQAYALLGITDAVIR